MKKTLAGMALAGLALVSPTPEARAAGCGGYVNVAVWGCAPWDNNKNRMPGTPGYKPPQAQRPAPVVNRPVAPPRVVVNPAGGRLIGQDGAGLRGVVSGGAGNAVAPGGANLISPGNRTGSGIISRDGAGLISNNRGGIIGDSGSGMRR